MKNSIIIIVFLHFVFLSFSQDKFFKVFTNNGYDKAEGIVQLADSSYLVTGTSSSFEEAPTNAFILKIDKTGNFVWSKAYGGTESDWGKRIFHVSNDGIYVMGHSNSFGNAFNFYAFKTNENGDLIWENNYGGSRLEILHDAIMLADTSFILVGETTSTNNEVENALIIRIDKFGNELWTVELGDENYDVARSVVVLDENTFFVSGELYVDEFSTQKAFITRMNKDSNIEWTKTYGVDGKHVIMDMVQSNDQLYAVGYKQDSENANKHVFLMIANNDGDENHYFTETYHNYYNKCITNYGTEGKFYLTTQYESASFDLFPVDEDYILYRYNQGLWWDNAFLNLSAIGQDQVNQMIPTSDGGAIVVGFNTNFSTGGNGATVLKIGPNDDFPTSFTPPVFENIVSINSDQEISGLLVYPNPFQNEISIINENKIELQYELYDSMGRSITNGSSNNNFTLSDFSVQKGVFFLEFTSKSTKYVYRLVKM
jgi:hypothetical protein